MRILIARHAQKDESAKSNINDHYHRSLTEIGKAQAESLGKYLRTFSINRIYCSDMMRALETAQIVARITGVEIADKSSELREADPCTIPDHPNRDIIKQMCWKDWNLKPEEGESYNEAKLRFANFFWDNIVSNTKENETVLIVSHGRVIRLFLSDYLPNGIEVIKNKYNHVSLTELDIFKDKRLNVRCYNDNSFLDDVLRL